MDTDLIIIGGGPGGYETAIAAAKKGIKTVIIESDEIGGTCLNRGCIPTKCFCRNADILRDINSANSFGIDVNEFFFDINKVVERKNKVVEQLRSGIDALLSNPDITRIKGHAAFKDRHTIVVGDEEYSAGNIIIATGSTTKFLPIPGAHSENVVTSTELLNIGSVPESLCIIGGGVIGMEFASIFGAFGSRVTVLEYCKEILPNFDSDIAKRLRLSLKSQGISIINNAEVCSIEGKFVSFNLKGEKQMTNADLILMAVGRAANVTSLNLDETGIEYDSKGIKTDNDFMTNIEGVYAVGDINGRCQLAHAATFQGKHVINKICNETDNIRFDIMPSAVFTCPEVASVGVSNDYCKSAGIAAKTYKAFYRANGKALAMDESEGIVKIIAGDDDRIIGAHILGEHASDMIHEIAAMMNRDCKVSDLADMIHAHPTLSEIILSAVS